MRVKLFLFRGKTLSDGWKSNRVLSKEKIWTETLWLSNQMVNTSFVEKEKDFIVLLKLNNFETNRHPFRSSEILNNRQSNVF